MEAYNTKLSKDEEYIVARFGLEYGSNIVMLDSLISIKYKKDLDSDVVDIWVYGIRIDEDFGVHGIIGIGSGDCTPDKTWCIKNIYLPIMERILHGEYKVSCQNS